MSLNYSTIETPIGEMIACANEQALLLLEFSNRENLQQELDQLKSHFNCEIIEERNPILSSIEKELKEYFNGSRQDFSTPIDFLGTEFQKRVWSELRLIPYGESRTYKEQAESLGDLAAIRAVASANGKNQLAIVVPCHRVIGSDGSLTGYAGGIEKKRFLLNLEREVAGPKDLFSK